MTKLLLFLLIPILLLGQQTVINDSFPNFSRVDATGLGHWIFKNENAHVDLSGNSNDLSPSAGFSVNYVDELTDDSPIQKDSLALTFDGSTEWDSLLQASATDFNSNQGDWSCEAWIKTSATLTGDANQYGIIGNQLGNGSGFAFYLRGGINGNGFLVRIEDSGNHAVAIKPDTDMGTTIANGSWHYLAITMDYNTMTTLYVDGIAVADTNYSSFSSNIVSSQDLFIGEGWAGNRFFDGTIAEIRFIKSLLSLQDIKEAYLAQGWTSYAGGVLRDAALGFNQGITGTIAKNIANTTQTAGYQWQMTWIDSVAGGTWTSRSYTFADNFSSDSLLFEISGTNLIAKYGASGTYTTVATIARAATTFIDNVVITEVQAPPATAPTSFVFNSIGNHTMKVSWTRGDGDSILVVCKEESAPSNPSDDTQYSVSSTFKNGEDLGSLSYGVYKGTGASFTLSGLKPWTTYYFEAWEFNQVDALWSYLGPLSGNQKTRNESGYGGYLKPGGFGTF